jgi:methylglutaconyl-CoA hydratase
MKVPDVRVAHVNASEWQSAQWAQQKGLYAEVHPTMQQLDDAVQNLAGRLSKSNPEAMALLKKIFWQGTEHWDKLLIERAEISGRLALSEFTKNAIAGFKTR